MPGIEPAEGQETMTAAEMPAETVSGLEEAVASSETEPEIEAVSDG